MASKAELERNQLAALLVDATDWLDVVRAKCEQLEAQNKAMRKPLEALIKWHKLYDEGIESCDIKLGLTLDAAKDALKKV